MGQSYLLWATCAGLVFCNQCALIICFHFSQILRDLALGHVILGLGNAQISLCSRLALELEKYFFPCSEEFRCSLLFSVLVWFFGFFLGRWMKIMSCCSLSSEAHGNILQLQESEWLQFLKLPFLHIPNWFLGSFLWCIPPARGGGQTSHEQTKPFFQ